MMSTLTESDVRRIVREEIAAAFSGIKSLSDRLDPVDTGVEGDDGTR